jgi:hypothetical protein
MAPDIEAVAEQVFVALADPTRPDPTEHPGCLRHRRPVHRDRSCRSTADHPPGHRQAPRLRGRNRCHGHRLDLDVGACLINVDLQEHLANNALPADMRDHFDPLGDADAEAFLSAHHFGYSAQPGRADRIGRAPKVGRVAPDVMANQCTRESRWVWPD